MAGIPNAVADALAAEARRRRQWDEPPGLYVMYVTGGRCRLAPVPLPEAAWDGIPAAQVIGRLAAAGTAHAALLQATAEPGLYGAALRTEAWRAETRLDDSAAAQAVIADGNAHRIKDRPDSIEIRQILAVDRSRITYRAELKRVTGDVHCSIIDPEPGREPVGAAADALDQLVSALLGVSMLGRTLHVG